jgi:hypothetical protein
MSQKCPTPLSDKDILTTLGATMHLNIDHPIIPEKLMSPQHKKIIMFPKLKNPIIKK